LEVAFDFMDRGASRLGWAGPVTTEGIRVGFGVAVCPPSVQLGYALVVVLRDP
jgi:hypothetical protein